MNTAPLAPPAKRSLAPLYWVLAVCIAPTIAAFAVYYGAVWQPNIGTTNYGELITTQTPVPALPSATTLDGQSFHITNMGKKWIYVTVNASACATDCATQLFNTRQQRAMTGRERERVARLWLVTDSGAIAPELLAAHTDLTIVRVAAAELGFLPLAPQQTLASHIWLVDALGRVMMRYPPQADPNKMKRDISKLLYASKGWQQ